MGLINVARREGSSWQAGIYWEMPLRLASERHTDLSIQTQKTIPKTYSRRIRSNPHHPRKSATTLGHCGLLQWPRATTSPIGSSQRVSDVEHSQLHLPTISKV
jgi:hypothetical protein